jgi:tetratricopeptide (TPR) repeat protein
MLSSSQRRAPPSDYPPQRFKWNDRNLDERPREEFSEALEELPDVFLVPETASGPSTVEFRSSQTVPTKEAWEAHRATIIRLYRDEDRTLKDVMQIMQAQHDFRATAKMYKSRLTAWDIRKYMTWAEREAACRVIKEKQGTGDAQGKVVVRGKEGSTDVFLRHMGRSRAGYQRRRLLQNEKGTQLNGLDITIDPGESQPLDLPIPPSVCPTGLERTLEIVCKETSSMVLTLPGNAVSNTVRQFLSAARKRSDIGHAQDVRILLNTAADWFREAIVSRPAEAILCLLRSPPLDHKLYHVELFTAFDRHLFDLTRMFYGRLHSITRLLIHILQLLYDKHLARVALQYVLREKISSLVQSKSSLGRRWQRHLAGILVDLGEHHKAKALLVSAVDSSRGEDLSKSQELLIASFNLACYYIYYNYENRDEAERILNDIRKPSALSATNGVPFQNVYYAHRGLGYLAEVRGNPDTAIKHYRLAGQAAINAWGEDDPLTVHAVHELSGSLREQGRDKQAEDALNLCRQTDLGEVENMPHPDAKPRSIDHCDSSIQRRKDNSSGSNKQPPES